MSQLRPEDLPHLHKGRPCTVCGSDRRPPKIPAYPPPPPTLGPSGVAIVVLLLAVLIAGAPLGWVALDWVLQ